VLTLLADLLRDLVSILVFTKNGVKVSSTALHWWWHTSSSSLNRLRPAMPSIDFRQLRANVSMAEVLELLRFVVAERTGDQVRGECPLHEPSESGKHRSFSAHLGRNIFQCFKCGASGNQLDLWAKASKKSLFEAALDLCTRLNKEAPRLAPAIEKRNP
jgi:DNA primase